MMQAAPPLSLPARGAAGPAMLHTNGRMETGALGAQGVVLQPGQWLFGRGGLRVATLLGAGVALVLWAPRLRVGAICHCVHPQRPGIPGPREPLDGRYCSEAALWLDQRFGQVGCVWCEVEAALAGGATGNSATGEGPSNVAWAQAWARDRGVALAQQDVGGRVLRRVTFNLGDGSLTVAHGGRWCESGT